MPPRIKSYQELDFLGEVFSSGGFESTLFTWFDHDDQAYFGQTKKPKLQLSLDEISNTLERVPDEHIYPSLKDNATSVHQAPDDLNLAPPASLSTMFIKRPPINNYKWYQDEDCLYILPATLLEEAAALEIIIEHKPHPNIVKFHGCRSRRNRITGLVLDRYEYDLRQFLQHGHAVDKERILNGLGSALQHLHSIGLAHNDVNPGNVMVDGKTSAPILVDFGSYHKIGAKLKGSRGTEKWMEEGDDYELSKTSHDLYGLEKIRSWLEGPVINQGQSSLQR